MKNAAINWFYYINWLFYNLLVSLENNLYLECSTLKECKVFRNDRNAIDEGALKPNACQAVKQHT